jgi:hypothetical protein
LPVVTLIFLDLKLSTVPIISPLTIIFLFQLFKVGAKNAISVELIMLLSKLVSILILCKKSAMSLLKSVKLNASLSLITLLGVCSKSLLNSMVFG